MLYEVITYGGLSVLKELEKSLPQYDGWVDDYSLQSFLNSPPYVITSYSIHYTKLYEIIKTKNLGAKILSDKTRGRDSYNFV